MLLNTPQKQFSLTFRNPIWQIRPDFEQEILALELRDGDRLQTEFVVLDAKTGLAQEPYQASENWWVGLEDTGWGILFLHGFADRKVGSHAGLTAVNINPQQVLWQHEQAVFYGLAVDFKILAQPNHTEKEAFIALDAQTGTVLETAIPWEQAYNAVTTFAQARQKLGLYPVHHTAGSAYFDLLSQFIFSRTGRQVVGAIDYLEVSNFLIFSYYEAMLAGKMKNILGIYSAEEGSLITEEIINASVAGLGTDSFLVMKNTLLFIVEKQTLVAYKLK